MTASSRTFLLDENVPRRILSALRLAGYAVTRVYDAGLRSQPEAVIFDYACVHRMTLITFDTDYLNQTVFSPPHAGIIVLRFFPRSTSVNELISAVLDAVALLADRNISNRLYQLTPDGLEEINAEN